MNKKVEIEDHRFLLLWKSKLLTILPILLATIFLFNLQNSECNMHYTINMAQTTIPTI